MLVGTSSFFRRLFTLLMIVGVAFVPTGMALAGASAGPVTSYAFATPIFGLAAAPDNSLLVADAGAGVVQLRQGAGSLVASLPNVTDVAPVGRGNMYAVTGGGPGPKDGKLFQVSRGKVKMLADLNGFEARVNPDGGEIDSNPFDVQVLTGGSVLVADAGGNDLLVVDKKGKVDWVATLPDQLVSTANAKSLVGCPTDNPQLGFVCGLPEMMPAQAVATSIAIGPDGAYYMGELKGFPGPVGMSRIWRIEPGTRHAVCGTDPACTVVADGFTSVVDLAFGPDGTLYVDEFDESSFLAVELAGLGFNVLKGGTIDACDSTTWQCREIATGLTMPISVAVDKTGQLYAAVNALLPTAQVITLP